MIEQAQKFSSELGPKLFRSKVFPYYEINIFGSALAQLRHALRLITARPRWNRVDGNKVFVPEWSTL